MRKKKNMLKRNSGFIVGCVLAAGASFFSADILMSEVLPEQGAGVNIVPDSGTTAALEPEKVETKTFETDPFTVTASGNVIKGVETESLTAESEEPETDEDGNVIQSETDANGNPVDGSGSESGDGSGEGEESGDGDGSYSDDSGNNYYSDDSDSSSGNYSDGSYGETIEIQNPGNGDYYYDDSQNGGSSDSSYDDGYYDDSYDDSYYDDGYDDGYDDSYDDGYYDDSYDDGSSDAWTPDDVIISGICSRYIDVSELYSYGPSTIRLIRNEIFAVNGRIFNSQDLMDYFCQKSWYVPTYNPEDFDANMFDYLNDYEEANLKLILEYEDWLATQ